MMVEPAATDDWERLHPATIVQLILERLPQLLLVTIFVLSGSGGVLNQLEAFLPILFFGPAVAQYLSSRYRIDAEGITFQRGVLNRRSTELPRSQIQAVDTSLDLFSRIFGLERLTISTASGGDSEIELGLLSREAAASVRSRLAAGSLLDLPPPPTPPVTVRSGDSPRQPTAPSTSLPAPTSFASPDPTTRVLAQLSAGDAFRVFLSRPGLTGFSTAVETFELTSSLDHARLHSRGGLLSVRSTEARIERVQGIRSRRFLLGRLLGVEELVVDTADASGTGASSTLMLNPVAAAGTWQSLRGPLLGVMDVVDLQSELVQLDHRARRRRYFAAARFGGLCLVVIAGIIVALGEIADLPPQARIAGGVALPLLVAAIILALVGAELGWRRHGYCLSDSLTVRSGWWTTTTVDIPLRAIESVTLSANWFQRRLGVATVHPDVRTLTLRAIDIVDLDRTAAEAVTERLLGFSPRE